MASSGNFTKWSSLFKDTNTASLKNANTTFDGTANGTSALTDFAIPVNTKFYAEIIAKLGSNYYNIFGIAPPTMNLATYARNLANVYGIEQRTNPGAYTINSISNTTVGSNSSSQGDLDGQVITYGIAVNRVDNEVKLYLDNTLKFTLSIPSTGEFHFMCSFTGGNNATTVRYNFNGGHDSTGAGDKTAASNTDENGFGEFQYTPLSGHLACCSANLPTSSDIDPGGDDGADENPTKQFGVATYTGNGGTQSINIGFQPDFLWFKNRGSANSWVMFDSTRGTTKTLNSNAINGESTGAYTNLDAFTSTGFDLDGGGTGDVNQSSASLLAYCWRANGGTTSSNSNGSITAAVQANTKAGFSIATYTSPGSGTNKTVGHGLSAVDFIITKNRSQSFNWYCFHKSAPNKTFRLNDGGEFTYSNWSMGATTWGSEDGYTHNSTDNYVAYCWQNVDGMQRFGSFEGNGSSDGPFVYLGFRPRLLVLKRQSSSGFWNVFDSGRKTNNSSSNPYLVWNAGDSEANGVPIDFLGQGFKVRSSGSGVNSSGNTILYMAWGDVPAKYNNAF